MPNKKKEIKKQRYNIILTPSNVDAADKMAFQDNRSRSGFIENLIAKEAERRKSALGKTLPELEEPEKN